MCVAWPRMVVVHRSVGLLQQGVQSCCHQPGVSQSLLKTARDCVWWTAVCVWLPVLKEVCCRNDCSKCSAMTPPWLPPHQACDCFFEVLCTPLAARRGLCSCKAVSPGAATCPY